MIDKKKILAIIPARGGSKGLPRKNVLPFAGKPLIFWTIEAAHSSQYIDHIILSSDDEEIINVAKLNNVDVPFVRPDNLASDTASGADVVLHALQNCPGFDILVLLQPTSPLRRADDIDGAIEKMIELKAQCCLSLSESGKSPYWAYEIDDNQHLLSVMPELDSKADNRQDLPETYYLNGAVYVAYSKWFQLNRDFKTKETIGYVMPRERSIDIDDKLDFIVAETLALRKV